MNNNQQLSAFKKALSFPHASNDFSEIAKGSTVTFVRSQDHLSFWNSALTGRQLTAYETFQNFGIDKILEAFEYGSAILVGSKEEPALTIKKQRESLGLSQENLSKYTGLSLETIVNCENPEKINKIRDLEFIGQALNIDERFLSIIAGANSDQILAARLKTLHQTTSNITQLVALKFTEAAWTIRNQSRIQKELGIPSSWENDFIFDENYGNPDYPAWQHGYFLAHKTREILGIDPEAPIFVRNLLEKIGIPLIYSELPEYISGATIATGDVRGVVVNTRASKNVWTWRATIAHELGHLLWDSAENLTPVRVDTSDNFDSFQTSDFVEMRANAFAIAFLAPLSAIDKIHQASAGNTNDCLCKIVSKFGISLTAAKFHLKNILGITCDKISINRGDENDDEWKGGEFFTSDYFPINSTPIERRGVFAKLAINAYEQNILSKDSLASYLRTNTNIVDQKMQFLKSIYDMKS